MTEDDIQYERQWHLDKKVPIALIVTLLAQSGVILWWAAGISFRIDQLEKSDIMRAPQAERLIRLEEQMHSITVGLDEIKHLLRTPPDRR
jgi:hypothetical protein